MDSLKDVRISKVKFMQDLWLFTIYGLSMFHVNYVTRWNFYFCISTILCLHPDQNKSKVKRTRTKEKLMHVRIAPLDKLSHA